MIRNFFQNKKIKSLNHHIDPDEVFLDAQNLPGFDRDQFEGRLEKPISQKSIVFLGLVFVLIGFSYLYRVWLLQVDKGEAFANQSENNRLRHTLIFSDRGLIYDRNGEPLAWNIPREEENSFDKRKYIDESGFANLLGYLKYPQKDRAGFYYEEDFVGGAGIEKYFDDVLKGENGLRIVETDALLNVVSDNKIQEPEHGESLTLSIDSELQAELYKSISEIANEVGFTGGGGVFMDVTNGEILALTSYPEYDSNILTEGKEVEKIQSFFSDKKNPFLNRITQGLYTPGSIMKPYMALGALNEGVVNENTIIVSTGEMVVPNKYDPSNPSIFTDWKAHGPVNVRQALAYSSNIYFYQIGGGFMGQKGIGIANIEKYMRLFGFGEKVSGDFFGNLDGTIPNPEWKEANFDGDPWRVGDTYFTSIGQYGFQVTPIQVIRAVSAIANGGKLYDPILIKDSEPHLIENISEEISPRNFEIVRSGMRDGVLFGTAKGLNIDNLHIAAKTGTAELGITKANVNSWVTGFYPYENPKYAFVVVMEKGSRHNLIGGVAVARRVFDWMRVYRPDLME